MKRKRLLLFIGMLFLLVGWAVHPGAGLAADKWVHYVSIGPMTGPGAATTLPFLLGLNDYFKELNARGGVDGVKIKYIVVDSRYDVARGISIFQRYRRLPKIIGYFTAKTGLSKALRPLLEQDHQWTLIAGGGFAQAKIGRHFVMMAAYQDIFGAALDWMVEDWKKKGNPGKPTVGYLNWVGAFGKQALNGGQQYAKKIGVKLLPPEFFPPGSLKHNTWLLRLAREGANYIYVGGTDPAQANIIRDAHALGLTEKIQMVASEWGLMSTIGLKAYKMNPEILEGSVLVCPLTRGDDRLKHPTAKLWPKYQKRPIEEMNANYLLGIGHGLITEEALKTAIKDVGYERVGGDAMIKALEQLTGKDVTQGILGPVAYSPTSRVATQSVKLYRIKSGKSVPITPWIKAPDCISLGKW